MTTDPLYKLIAQTIAWNPDDAFFIAQREDRLRQLENLLPSGSGIDSGTTIERDSTSERIVLCFSFHHMNDAGMYDGWTEHKLILEPSLQFDFVTTITGRNRNGIKDYLYDTFDYALRDEIGTDVSEDRHASELAYYSVSMREAAKAYQASIASGKTV